VKTVGKITECADQ